MLPGEASWKLGTINKLIDSVKDMATKLARRVLHDVSAQEIFDAITTAHGDLHRRHGFSPFQLMTGRTPKGIGPPTPELGTASATLQSGPMQKRLEIQRAAYEIYLNEHINRGAPSAGAPGQAFPNLVLGRDLLVLVCQRKDKPTKCERRSFPWPGDSLTSAEEC